MKRPQWIIGLAFLALAVLLAGCRVGQTTLSDEEIIRAAVDATIASLGQAPGQPQVTRAPVGPAAPPGTPVPAAAQPSPAEVRRISVAETKEKADAGTALLVDARAARSYAQAHIAGAISMPHNEVALRYTELPQDKAIVFYCT